MARSIHEFDEHDYASLAAARGVIALLVGAVAVLFPDAALEALVFLVAGYALADGITSMGTALAALGDRRRSLPFFFEAVVDLGFAAALLLAPRATIAVLLPIVALWAGVTGVIELLAALAVDGDDALPLALSGLVSLGLGLALYLVPGLTVTVLLVYFGAKLVVFGLAQLGLAARLL